MNDVLNLNLKRAFQEGWKGTKSNFLFLLGATIIISVFSYIPSVLDYLVPDGRKDTVFGFILLIIIIGNWFLQIIMSMGMIRIALRILDQQPLEYQYLFSEYKKVWRMIGACILYGLLVMIGFVFLVIPGIYLALKYQFFAYRIVEANEGVLESLRKSGELTRGSIWKLFGLTLLNILVTMAGVLVFFVGLFVAMPVTMIATASAYRQLTGQSHSASTLPSPATVPPVPASTPTTT